jgi:hypothetical protein
VYNRSIRCLRGTLRRGGTGVFPTLSRYSLRPLFEMCVVLLCEFRFSFPVRGLRYLVFLRFFHLWFAAAFAMAITMDVNVALITALYVVLIQAFADYHCNYGLHDDVVMDDSLSGASLLDSHDCALAISTATLFDYRLSAGLICFDDKLRYWVKSRSTT